MAGKQKQHATVDWDTLQALLDDALAGADDPGDRKRVHEICHRLRVHVQDDALPATTDYVNTIPARDEPEYPGDLKLERKLENMIRWNAMAMIVRANKGSPGIGGHISTFASIATLYEVGFNQFFHGPDGDDPADFVLFQGHASPGNYARAFVEGRLSETEIRNLRRDLAADGGVSSYPHPYLMPGFWEAPTVSMGLGPVMSIYRARFYRYLQARELVDRGREPRIWGFFGDGEMDEPESSAGLSLAAQQQLDNLTWVVNCNLQRLDGPVRGNGKIIQELEARFRGAGWNVIKVIWGSEWDSLLARDTKGLLRQRMMEAVDGDFQLYSASPGSTFRDHFFGARPELLEMVSHLSDEDLQHLSRGGHDPIKIHAAYQAATEHAGAPTVILAKSIKGYGLGEAGAGLNITHQQKKLDEKALRAFRDRFEIPLSEVEVAGSRSKCPPPCPTSPRSSILTRPFPKRSARPPTPSSVTPSTAGPPLPGRKIPHNSPLYPNPAPIALQRSLSRCLRPGRRPASTQPWSG